MTEGIEQLRDKQHKFECEGSRYILVLMKTKPEKGIAEFSLVGKPLQ